MTADILLIKTDSRIKSGKNSVTLLFYDKCNSRSSYFIIIFANMIKELEYVTQEMQNKKTKYHLFSVRKFQTFYR